MSQCISIKHSIRKQHVAVVPISSGLTVSCSCVNHSASELKSTGPEVPFEHTEGGLMMPVMLFMVVIIVVILK